MHIAYTGQLLDLALEHTIEGAEEILARMESTQQELADRIAQHFDIHHRGTDFWDAHLASSFAPAYDGQHCPDELKPIDTGSDWAIGEDHIDAPPSWVIFFHDQGPLTPSVCPQFCRIFDDNIDVAAQELNHRHGFHLEGRYAVNSASLEEAFIAYCNQYHRSGTIPISVVAKTGYNRSRIWKALLMKFLQPGMAVEVGDPRTNGATHSHGFCGTVIEIHETHITVEDMDDDCFDVDFMDVVETGVIESAG